RGWVRALLAASLALNLAIGGYFAGGWMAGLMAGGSDSEAGEKSREGHGAGGRRDNGLGPLATAMRGEDWRAMREAWVSSNPDLRRGHAQLRADYDPLLAALRAEPFDGGAVQAALATISESNSRRLISASEVIGAYLAGLDEPERQA